MHAGALLLDGGLLADGVDSLTSSSGRARGAGPGRRRHPGRGGHDPVPAALVPTTAAGVVAGSPSTRPISRGSTRAMSWRPAGPRRTAAPAPTAEQAQSISGTPMFPRGTLVIDAGSGGRRDPTGPTRSGDPHDPRHVVVRGGRTTVPPDHAGMVLEIQGSLTVEGRRLASGGHLADGHRPTRVADRGLLEATGR